MKKLELVDYLKGYAITTIVLFHLIMLLPVAQIFKLAANFGGAGAHVFILCSGFGLYLSYLYKPSNYVDFLKRRISRVHIPFVLVILVTAFFSYLDKGIIDIYALCGNIFFWKMFDSTITGAYGMQMWFVSTIVQFYLFFPLITLCFNKLGGGKLLIISVLISVLYATFVGVLGRSESRSWNSFFLQYLWEFSVGMYFASVYKTKKKLRIPSRKILIATSILGCTITGVCGIIGGLLKLYNDIPSVIGYLSLSLLLYSFKITPLNKFFLWINKFSYEWYLVHILVFSLFFRIFGNSIFIGCTALFFSIIVASFYMKLISICNNCCLPKHK